MTSQMEAVNSQGSMQASSGTRGPRNPNGSNGGWVTLRRGTKARSVSPLPLSARPEFNVYRRPEDVFEKEMGTQDAAEIAGMIRSNREAFLANHAAGLTRGKYHGELEIGEETNLQTQRRLVKERRGERVKSPKMDRVAERVQLEEEEHLDVTQEEIFQQSMQNASQTRFAAQVAISQGEPCVLNLAQQNPTGMGQYETTQLPSAPETNEQMGNTAPSEPTYAHMQPALAPVQVSAQGAYTHPVSMQQTNRFYQMPYEQMPVFPVVPQAATMVTQPVSDPVVGPQVFAVQPDATQTANQGQVMYISPLPAVSNPSVAVGQVGYVTRTETAYGTSGQGTSQAASRYENAGMRRSNHTEDLSWKNHKAYDVTDIAQRLNVDPGDPDLEEKLRQIEISDQSERIRKRNANAERQRRVEERPREFYPRESGYQGIRSRRQAPHWERPMGRPRRQEPPRRPAPRQHRPARRPPVMFARSRDLSAPWRKPRDNSNRFSAYRRVQSLHRQRTPSPRRARPNPPLHPRNRWQEQPRENISRETPKQKTPHQKEVERQAKMAAVKHEVDSRPQLFPRIRRSSPGREEIELKKIESNRIEEDEDLLWSRLNVPKLQPLPRPYFPPLSAEDQNEENRLKDQDTFQVPKIRHKDMPRGGYTAERILSSNDDPPALNQRRLRGSGVNRRAVWKNSNQKDPLAKQYSCAKRYFFDTKHKHSRMLLAGFANGIRPRYDITGQVFYNVILGPDFLHQEHPTVTARWAIHKMDMTRPLYKPETVRIIDDPFNPLDIRFEGNIQFWCRPARTEVGTPFHWIIMTMHMMIHRWGIRDPLYHRLQRTMRLEELSFLIGHSLNLEDPEVEKIFQGIYESGLILKWTYEACRARAEVDLVYCQALLNTQDAYIYQVWGDHFGGPSFYGEPRPRYLPEHSHNLFGTAQMLVRQDLQDLQNQGRIAPPPGLNLPGTGETAAMVPGTRPPSTVHTPMEPDQGESSGGNPRTFSPSNQGYGTPGHGPHRAQTETGIPDDQILSPPRGEMDSDFGTAESGGEELHIGEEESLDGNDDQADPCPVGKLPRALGRHRFRSRSPTI